MMDAAAEHFGPERAPLDAQGLPVVHGAPGRRQGSAQARLQATDSSEAAHAVSERAAAVATLRRRPRLSAGIFLAPTHRF